MMRKFVLQWPKINHLIGAEGKNYMECQSIINEGGCMTCRECGWSKCD